MASGSYISMLLLAVACIILSVNSSKILMMPISVSSHQVFFGQLAVGLVKDGHEVTLVATSASKLPANLESEGVSVYRYEGDKEQYASSDVVSELLMKSALSSNVYENYNRELELWDILVAHSAFDCEKLYNNTQLFHKIKKDKFDFAILDGTQPFCYYALAYKLGIPYATFSIPYSFLFMHYRCPHLSSQWPNLYLYSSNEMNFFTRLTNTILDILEFTMTHSIFEDQQTEVMKRLLPDEPHISSNELMRRSKLWLILGDPILSFPYSTMPNMVNIGDIMSRESKSLTKDLKSLVDQAKYGVILVSFGTMMSAMPEVQSRIIFKGLGQVKQTVIMKKAGYIPEDVSSNIKLLEWLPQNDLLGHPNVKLFISHCGLNSVIEAVSYGVPILAIPIAFDQPYNAFLVQDKGIGKQLKFGTFTSEELSLNIHDILNTNTYADNARKLSSIFKDKTLTAAARASHMINHVIMYGDDHLRTKAFSLNVLQFYMLDIYTFLLLCLVVFCSICILLVRLVCRCLFSCFCPWSSSQKHKEE